MSPRRKKSEKKKPSPREQKFVQGVIEDKSDMQAALDAGFTESMAKNTKKRIWSKPEVQQYYTSLIKKLIPPDRVAQKLSEHVEGKEVTTRVRRKMGPPDAQGNRAVLEEVVERTETVNAGVSLRALELAIEGGEYTPPREPAVEVNNNILQLTQLQIKSDDAVVAKLLGG